MEGLKSLTGRLFKEYGMLNVALPGYTQVFCNKSVRSRTICGFSQFALMNC